MTRLASLLIGAISIAALAAGCSKPSEADCRKALANMQRLMGTENLRDEGRMESEVRRCKGGSKKKAVACAIKAQTLDDLRHCEFFHIPPNVKVPSEIGSGSGAVVVPPAGSGATEPAGSGSAGSGSAGSSAGPAAGGSASGIGSASGSAVTGDGSGSPKGAASAGATGAGSAK